MKTSLLHDQIKVYLAHCIKQNREGGYSFWLRSFSKRYVGSAEDISDDDIDDFLVDVGALYNGQFSLNQAERAVRGLRTYYTARSRNLERAYEKDYDRDMEFAEKKLRNRKLIALRKADPRKYSWRNLGVLFDIHFTTAKDIFVRNERKKVIHS